MKSIPALGHRGILAALGAAALFGRGAPLAKWLPGHVDPWMLTGMLTMNTISTATNTDKPAVHKTRAS